MYIFLCIQGDVYIYIYICVCCIQKLERMKKDGLCLGVHCAVDTEGNSTHAGVE